MNINRDIALILFHTFISIEQLPVSTRLMRIEVLVELEDILYGHAEQMGELLFAAKAELLLTKVLDLEEEISRTEDAGGHVSDLIHEGRR